MKQSKLYIISLFIVILAFVFHIFFSLINCTTNLRYGFNVSCAFFAFGGIIIYFLFSLLSKIKANISKLHSFTLLILLSLTIVFLDFIGIIFCSIENSLSDIVPKQKKYAVNLSKITSKKDRIKHFPTNLPENAVNYYFFIENSAHGDNLSYLKFNTDETYIKNTIGKQKVYKKIKFSEINKYYKFIDELNIKDKENSYVYILKNLENDKNYTSGIVASKNGEILFFYANFDLRHDME